MKAYINSIPFLPFHFVMDISQFQVCMADIATEKGHNLVQKFTTEYGAGKAFFSRCDVKSEEDIKRLYNF